MAIETLLDYLKVNEKTFKIIGEQFELYNTIISSYDITPDSLEIWLTGANNGRVLIDISNFKEAIFTDSIHPVKTSEEMESNIVRLLHKRERVNINFFDKKGKIILGVINLAI